MDQIVGSHTPVPWEVVPNDGTEPSILIRTTTGRHQDGEKDVCLIDDTSSESYANAVFIVRACNSHDDLLAALEAMLTQWKSWDLKGSPTDDEIMENAENAIRKARGA
jgi:hypothetical protein